MFIQKILFNSFYLPPFYTKAKTPSPKKIASSLYGSIPTVEYVSPSETTVGDNSLAGNMEQAKAFSSEQRVGKLGSKSEEK